MRRFLLVLAVPNDHAAKFNDRFPDFPAFMGGDRNGKKSKNQRRKRKKTKQPHMLHSGTAFD